MSRVVARYPGKKIQHVGTRKKRGRGNKKKKKKKSEKIQFSALSSAYRIHFDRGGEKIGIFKFGMAIFYGGGVIKRKFCLAPIIT